jgi:hypothetical protein
VNDFTVFLRQGKDVNGASDALPWSALRRAGIEDRRELGRPFDVTAIPEA